MEIVLTSLFFCPCDKYLRKQLKRRKGLFCLMISEISVHGQFAPLLWACGEVEHHGSRSRVDSLTMGARKQRKTERDWG
jgi:hypothetical protein